MRIEVDFFLFPFSPALQKNVHHHKSFPLFQGAK